MTNRDLRLLKLATRASLIRTQPDSDELYSLIGPALFWDDDLGGVAKRIAQRALNIGTAALREDRVRRRGAFLERLVYELVSDRIAGATFREHEVQLTHSPRSRRSWTRPKEAVASGPAFEIYECKSDGLPDVGDIDELSDVRTTAIAESVDCRPTIVVFGSEMDLRLKARAWRMTETIFGVTTDRIFALRGSAPDRPIVPA
ncbi:MAG: hypothetical protein V4515_07885 [Chloroflexota bacterium]